jgi:hypothetical protein
MANNTNDYLPEANDFLLQETECLPHETTGEDKVYGFGN